MSDAITCPKCGHSGDYGEFNGHNDDLAPDLVGTFNCPECDHFWEGDDDFADTKFEVTLECPSCGADVDYEDGVVVDELDDHTGCPVCNVARPTDDWFA